MTIPTQKIALESQGLYVSEENATYTFGVGLIFLIVVLFLFYWRRKISQTIRKKPEKSWKMPEEQQHLAELRRTDKNTYEQERLMSAIMTTLAENPQVWSVFWYVSFDPDPFECGNLLTGGGEVVRLSPVGEC